jgi:uncharacterized NAD(P)/FAD-binding protein YdhS
MTGSGGRHVIIIGGGASGVLLAHQLLHQPGSDCRVTLIEQRPDIGRGLAYHTGNPDHLLNVRVANMSALPDQPDHFWRWLISQGDDVPRCPDSYCFVPRRVYGDIRNQCAELATLLAGDDNEKQPEQSRQLASV